MAAQPDGDPGGRATVREVYQLVGEVRTEVLGKIDELAEDVRKVVTAQEHRLTVLETVSLQHTGTLTDHSTRIGALEVAHQRAIGHLTAWKVAGGVVTGALALIIADLISKAVGG